MKGFSALSPVVAVICARNEEGRVGKVAGKCARICDAVVCVDGASTDGTVGEMRRSVSGRGKVIALPRNVGKGGAMRAGFDYATRKLGAKTVVSLDADGQHRPEEIPRLLREMRDSGADIVVGCRAFDRRMPLKKRVGNLALSAMARLLFGLDVEDTQSGFRALSARATSIFWNSPHYAAETEHLMLVKKAGLSISSCRISTIYLDAAKGTGLKDGVGLAAEMLRWRFFGGA